MTDGDRGTRVVLGRARVAGEVRAAVPLGRALAVPVTAGAPWLTTVLSVQSVHRRPRLVPVAVVVGPHRSGRPDALALLALATAGPAVTATLLGDGLPVPGGRPPARLLARDEDAAERLAAGVLGALTALRRPWRLRLAGLPMGDPTVRALGRLRPDARMATARTTRLVDALDDVPGAPVVRSRDARDLDRVLPALLAGERSARVRDHVRAAARLHAALGRVEVATLSEGGRLCAGLLTLLDGEDRLPWWGWSRVGGLDGAAGAPSVGFAVGGRGRVLRGVLDRTAGRLPARPVSRRRGSG
ncbi:hypothetical protein JOD57_001624 [Geodermatophilus bullaregiensis]|uniref:hypothetical protein n=1 Tax=Geodermatophilus bullaregiensis TaxID=1564160 RepID=UPI00195BDA3B|nr:hypothetical protein [Geodermatophilus bullaregiensis]MBM7805787.1 hypothetical protein [Geodermatophilus bullaregiensis]